MSTRKFRALHKALKRYIDVPFMLSSDGTFIRWFDPPNEFVSEIPSAIIVEEFTGFVDMDGSEIWEGDLVNVDDKIGTVVFSPEIGAWCVHLDDDCVFLFDRYFACSVAGNVNLAQGDEE